MVPGWVSFKIVSDSPTLHSRWLLLLKIEISSIVHCCFSISQNELKFYLQLHGKEYFNIYSVFKGHVSYCHHFSSVVRPSTFHILIFSSETTGPIATKLWWSGPLQNCVRWCRLPTKMAAKLKIEKRGDEIKKISSSLKLLKWSLGGSLPKLCPAFQTSDQDGRHSQT